MLYVLIKTTVEKKKTMISIMHKIFKQAYKIIAIPDLGSSSMNTGFDSKLFQLIYLTR